MQDNDKKAATLNESQLFQQINYNRIPKELQEKNRWVCFKFAEREGQEKPSKIPMNPWNGKNAACNKSETWSDFQAAVSAMAKYNFDGIGFQLGDGIFGVDLDNCFDNDGNLSGEAEDIVSRLNSYTEISPSRKGLHILALGKIPEGERKNTKKGFEVYSTGRYFTVTGAIFESRTEFREATNEINMIHEKYFQKERGFIRDISYENPKHKNSFSDYEILEKAMNSSSGYKLKALWNGDISDYSSHSDADMALCNYLAFWCNKDAVKMDNLFRKSSLIRNKWDEKRGSQTYGQITINKAIISCGEIYKDNFDFVLNENSSEDGWEDPIILDEVKITEFPVDSYPKIISDFLKALCESTETASEMGGVLMLGVLASCSQGKYRVQIKTDYSEPINLYTVAIANPAERKTAVIDALTYPICKYEEEWLENHKTELTESRAKRRFFENQLNRVEKGNDKKEVLRINQELEKFKETEEIKELRLLIDDVTPEVLIKIMENHNERITLASDEGGFFENLKGRYENENIDVYLKGHSGSRISVDRVSRNRNKLKKPKLTLILAVQPTVIREFVNNERFMRKGLPARFLYALCESKLGKRSNNSASIPENIKEKYNDLISFLLRREPKEPQILRMSEEAYSIYKNFEAEVEIRLPDDNKWGSMQAYGGKNVGAMMRIAGLLHVARCINIEPEKMPISAQTVTDAIKIIECLNSHAERVFKEFRVNEDLELTKYVWARIKKFSDDKITKSELYQKCRHCLKSSCELDQPLRILEDRNYILTETIKPGSKGGRSSIKINVNPKAKYDKNSKNLFGSAGNTIIKPFVKGTKNLKTFDKNEVFSKEDKSHSPAVSGAFSEVPRAFSDNIDISEKKINYTEGEI